jgi:uncharacterized membrane protein YkvA (DUF1232 family)
VNPLLLPHEYDRSPFGRVRDLRQLLAEYGLSPEQLAERTGVSNMTWRRLLSKRDATQLPEKYRAVLERHFAPNPPELDEKRIALAGLGGSESAVLRRVAEDASAIESETRLLREVERKRKSVRGLPARLGASLADLLERLPRASLAAKALILGALAYFLNPLDLVADALLGIGFLDDAGVVAIVLKKLSLTKRARVEGQEA